VRHRRGVAVRRRHSPITREHARTPSWRAIETRALGISNLGVQGVKGQGPSPPRHWLGGDSRYGAKEKDPATCQALAIREADEPCRYREASPLICCAWQAAP
jgi:hypothetical protein